MRGIGRVVLGWGAAGLTAGCATLLPFGLSSSLEHRILRTWQERARAPTIGHLSSALVREAGGPSTDRAAHARVEHVVARVVAISQLRGSALPTVVLRNDQVNAFTEGRGVYVFTGLLDLVGPSNDALAGVIAHELSHVIARHPQRRSQRDLLLGVGGAVAAALLEDRSGQATVGELTALLSPAYNRAEETEADVLGLVLAHAAGFEPQALSDFFDVLDNRHRQVQRDAEAHLRELTAQYQANVDTYRAYERRYQQAPTPELAAALQEAQVLLAQQRQAIEARRAALSRAFDPLYSSHPIDAHRRRTVDLIAAYLEGRLTLDDLSAQAPHLAATVRIAQHTLPVPVSMNP